MTITKAFRDICQRLAHNLSRFRAERGLTLEQLAERSGVASGELSTIEAGKGNITLETIALLADALSVDPAELVAAGTSRSTTGK